MSKHSGYERQDVPPASGKYIQLLKIDAKFYSHLIVCSPGLMGTYTHWAGRTVPHLPKFTGGCPWCKKQLPKHWKGYLHVTNVNGKGSSFLELTTDAANLLKEQLGTADSFRGAIIHVKRSKGTLRSTLALELISWAEPTLVLPEPKEPWPTLERLWGTQI